MNESVNLSEMRVGDRGWDPVDSCVAELRDGGLSGGAETDLYLALVEDDGADYPVIIIDTDAVSV